MAEPEILDRMIDGYAVKIDHVQGHLCVAHDGAITWDALQAIKDKVWGPLSRAIEVYPASDRIVNSGSYRHLWRLGGGDFCPDLLGDARDSLEARHATAWANGLPDHAYG